MPEPINSVLPEVTAPVLPVWAVEDASDQVAENVCANNFAEKTMQKKNNKKNFEIIFCRNKTMVTFFIIQFVDEGRRS